VLTTKEIASFTGVASGSTVNATWRGFPAGAHGWYVQTTGPHGGIDSSVVQTFTALAPGDLTTATPVIAGVPSVGGTLVANAGTWGPAGVQLGYQWYADGKPIAGATGTTLNLGTGQVGKRIAVRVTGTLAGHDSATTTSAPTPAVAPGRLSGKAPRITGKAKVGALLRATKVRWSPAPVTVRYQWYVGSTAMKGAHSSTLWVGKALIGKRLKLRVTASKPGDRTDVATSPSTGKEATMTMRSHM
jgi:hypothetical protein